MSQSQFQRLLASLPADRDIFPHQYSSASDQILLVRIGDDAVRQASFLDERVLPQGAQGAWFNADAVANAACAMPTPAAAYLFHASHCGSTLVSRLLGASSNAVSLREPLPLRAFAFDLAEGGAAFLTPDRRAARLRLFERIWGRAADRLLVKATSICTGLAELCGSSAGRRGAFLTQNPAVHLAVLLAGANAQSDLRAFAQLRWRRLMAQVELPPLAGYSIGELAALGWLCEGMAAHCANLPTFDFDAVLRHPRETITSIASALDAPLDASALEAAINGPIMRQYSKAPEHDYDADLRNRIIADSRVANAAEIARGLAWLRRLAMSDASVAKIIEPWGAF